MARQRAALGGHLAAAVGPGAMAEAVAPGGCIEATPAVWRGRVYVGTRGGALYAIG